MARELVLSGGRVCYLDEEAWGVLRRYNWHVVVSGLGLIVRRRVRIHGLCVNVYLHRLLANAPRVFRVCFRNGNWLDYRFGNMYMRDRLGSGVEYLVDEFRVESQYDGVYFDRYWGLWRSELLGMVIGYYMCEDDAARAYNIKLKDVKDGRRRFGYNEFDRLGGYIRCGGDLRGVLC